MIKPPGLTPTAGAFYFKPPGLTQFTGAFYLKPSGLTQFTGAFYFKPPGLAQFTGAFCFKPPGLAQITGVFGFKPPGLAQFTGAFCFKPPGLAQITGVFGFSHAVCPFSQAGKSAKHPVGKNSGEENKKNRAPHDGRGVSSCNGPAFHFSLLSSRTPSRPCRPPEQYTRLEAGRPSSHLLAPRSCGRAHR